MLDPEWTPEKGYSHADGLLAILAKHDEEQRRTEIVEEMTDDDS